MRQVKITDIPTKHTLCHKKLPSFTLNTSIKRNSAKSENDSVHTNFLVPSRGSTILFSCFTGDKKEFLENIRQALYASKIVSYAQGFMLMRQAAEIHGWKLNYGGIALMWRGGCIIRSVFLGKKESIHFLFLRSFIFKIRFVCRVSSAKPPSTSRELRARFFFKKKKT